MKSYTIARWGLILSGSCIVLINGVILLTWILGYKFSFWGDFSFSIINSNIATCLFLIGMGELFLAWNKEKWLLGVSFVVVVLSLGILIQYCLNAQCEIGEIFHSYGLDFDEAIFNTGICLLFGGLGLSVFAFNDRFCAIAVTLYALVFGLALVSIFGYILKIDKTIIVLSFWGISGYVASMGLIFSSALIGAAIVRVMGKKYAQFVVPLMGFIIISIGSTILWQAVQSISLFSIQKIMEQNAKFIQTEIKRYFNDVTLAIERMASRWHSSSETAQILWNKDRENYLKDITPLTELYVLDSSFEVFAWDENRFVEKEIFSEDVIKQLKNLQTVVLYSFQRKAAFVLAPVQEDYVFKGVIVGKILLEVIFNSVVTDAIVSDYIVEIRSGGEVIFVGGAVQLPKIGLPIEEYMDMNTIDLEMRLYLSKKTTFLMESRTGYFILIMGFVLAVVFYLLIYLILHSMKRKKELELANKKAVEATFAKGLFLANMSHEIRTPMNAILGTIQLLQEMELNPIQEKYVNRIQSSGQSLLKLISEILDFSKIESGTITLQLTQFNLEKRLKEIVSNHYMKAKEKNIEMFIDFPSQVIPEVVMDFGRLEQVINNLINNALKFTTQGYLFLKVSITMTGEDQGTLWCELEDTGKGIDPMKLNKLFERFSQIDPIESRKLGGVGLGLAICKKLVELMKGKIGVISRLDRGSRFWFEVPITVKGGIFERKILHYPIYFVAESVKEDEVISKVLQGFGLIVYKTDPKDAKVALISASQEKAIQEAKQKGLSIILILDKEPKDPGISSYIVRPLIPSEIFAALEKFLDKG